MEAGGRLRRARHEDGRPRPQGRTGQNGTVTTEDRAGDELVALRVELWASRDAVIGAEAAAGQLRAQVRALESELDDRRRHADALLIEVASLRDRIDAL